MTTVARFSILVVVAALVLPPAARGDGGVGFVNIAVDDGAGITYRRVPSASNARFDAIKRDPPYDQAKRIATPMKARGAPGVALLDYDGDGDLDIYVTNGPGAANSLYSNQLRESGRLDFVDVGAASGAGAADQDSTGVCFGDIDNDNDPDLLVLSHNSADRLFENRGDGTFADITAASGIAAGPVRASSGCSMGDVDGDGLLDIAIGNSFTDWESFAGIFLDPFDFNEHNQLLLNAGGNVFVDASAAAGVTELAGFPAEAAGAAGLTWAIALVDVDLDGDLDLLTADDQGGIPSAANGGVDRGLLHLLRNDGSGRLVDDSVGAGTNKFGSWMGLSFGDFDCDGTMDFFATNFGDYTPVGIPEPGQQPSRWFLGRGDGSFADPGIGDMVTNPFGWGTSTLDYDNDGDLDVVYHGGHDVGPGIESANPGVILQNRGCSARFEWDAATATGETDHNRRAVHGVAVGDLNEDGWVDIVSVSNFDIPPDVAFEQYAPLGSPFDGRAVFVNTFEPNAVGELIWNGNVYDDGTLAVEMNSGGNGNAGVSFDLVGGVGLVSGARVNRSAIGAVVRFRPNGGEWTMRPVVGGSSYASQDSLTAHFGVGEARKGIVEVLWPGGVRNRLYNVQAGERVLLPEIPCSFDDGSRSFRSYLGCVVDALEGYRSAGVIGSGERIRLLLSALRAYQGIDGPGGGASCGLEAVLGAWDPEG